MSSQKGLNENRSNDQRMNGQIPNFIDCQRCLEGFGSNFRERLEYFKTLPPEKKLEEMWNDLMEIELRSGIKQLDFRNTLDQMIRFEEAALVRGKGSVECGTCSHDRKQLALCQAEHHLQPGIPKLVVNAEVGELVALLKLHLISAKNKKGLPFVDLTNKEITLWICNTFSLSDNKEMVYNTVVNALSKY